MWQVAVEAERIAAKREVQKREGETNAEAQIMEQLQQIDSDKANLVSGVKRRRLEISSSREWQLHIGTRQMSGSA